MKQRAWVIFAAMCVIWGIPYLLIRVAVRDVEPGTLVFARTALGAAILLPIALHRRELAAAFRRWRPLLAYTVIEVAIPWVLINDAERNMTSSLAGLLVAAVPLVGVVLALLIGDDRRIETTRLAGLLLGVVGLVCVLGLDVGEVHAVAVAEMAVVAVAYAVGPIVLARGLSDLPPIGVVTASLLLTAGAYLPYAVLNPPERVAAEAVWSVVVLASVCTALAFVLFFELINTIGPARATVIAYVNPVVAVLLGVLVLDEPFTLGMAVGLPLVLIGSVLAARRRSVHADEPLGGLEDGREDARVVVRRI